MNFPGSTIFWLEIDNLEVPILDGSGKPFVDLLREAGSPRSCAANADTSEFDAQSWWKMARNGSRFCRTTPFA